MLYVWFAIFFAAGHVFRDGTPNFGDRMTWLARAVGAALCGVIVGVSDTAGDWHALASANVVAIAFYIGFVIDRLHSEGGNAITFEDALYNAVSGATSILPVAVAHALYYHLTAPPLNVLGSTITLTVVIYITGWCLAAGVGKGLIYWLAGPLTSSERILRWRLQPILYGAYLGILFVALR